MTIEKIDVVGKLQTEIESVLCPHGFEVRPFLTGWYNQLVSDKFHLDYPEDTLAFVIISQPLMFEKAFLPFLSSHYKSGPEIRDPIDECMLHYFSLLAPRLKTDAVTLHDFQLSPARRPKVLVQTAGHVSGAATFYQPKNYPELADKKYYPVCHHPVWGGWFALRGVAILPGTRVNLPRPQLDQSLSPDQAVDMITLYNECWQDWRWRDVGRTETCSEKYSAEQIKYFETPPGKRFEVIESITANMTS